MQTLPGIRIDSYETRIDRNGIKEDSGGTRKDRYGKGADVPESEKTLWNPFDSYSTTNRPAVPVSKKYHVQGGVLSAALNYP